jgi:hypothetical protein
MMSWVIESPTPVPSPVGLVVKKGLKIFSLISGGIPVPLSRIRISTASPAFLVAAEHGLERLAVVCWFHRPKVIVQRLLPCF